MKRKKISKPTPQDHDILLPALILILGIWFLVHNATKLTPTSPYLEDRYLSISEEVVLKTNSSTKDLHWFARAIALRTKKDIN